MQLIFSAKSAEYHHILYYENWSHIVRYDVLLTVHVAQTQRK